MKGKLVLTVFSIIIILSGLYGDAICSDIYSITGFEQSLKMLQVRRIDVFIVGTVMEESTPMKSDAYQDIKRVGIVEEKIVYPWFHKRHRELVPRLADTLKAMKTEGTFQKLTQEAKRK